VDSALGVGRQWGTGIKPDYGRHRRAGLWRRGGRCVSVLVAAALVGGAAGPTGLAPGHGLRAGHGGAAGRGLTAYVTSPSLSNTGWVTPINTMTNRPGKPIKVGDSPLAVAITPGGKTAYVANSGSGTVIPIATATNTPGKPIKSGNSPAWIAITPNGKTAYVANQGAGIGRQGGR